MFRIANGNHFTSDHPIPLVFLLLFFIFISKGCTAVVMTQDTGTLPKKQSKPLAHNESEKSLENSKTFQGLYVHGHEVRSMILCGESTELWVIDHTDGDIQSIHQSMTGAPNESIFVEIKGYLTDPPEDGFGSEYAGAIVFEKLIHVSRVEESRGCREKYDAFIVKAQGNEPGWTVLVTKAGIQFSSIEHNKTIEFPLVSPAESEEAITYTTHSGTHSLQLFIRQIRCADTMSDEVFGWEANITLDGKSYSGCAKQGKQVQ